MYYVVTIIHTIVDGGVHAMELPIIRGMYYIND